MPLRFHADGKLWDDRKYNIDTDSDWQAYGGGKRLQLNLRDINNEKDRRNCFLSDGQVRDQKRREREREEFLVVVIEKESTLRVRERENICSFIVQLRMCMKASSVSRRLSQSCP